MGPAGRRGWSSETPLVGQSAARRGGQQQRGSVRGATATVAANSGWGRAGVGPRLVVAGLGLACWAHG